MLEKTHFEMSKKAARPCNVHDITYGGRCFNCGFDPDPAATKIQIKAQREMIKFFLLGDIKHA